MACPVLGVDFGTSNTAAVLHRAERGEPLLFDGSPLLPSAVHLDADLRLLVGRDAERAAGAAPARFEPNPKRRIDDGTIWLGEHEITVVDAIGGVLHRVAVEAFRVLGTAARETVLTHPAGWGGPRMQVLAAAAARAELPAVRFVPEPVAAASYFTAVLGRQLPTGRCVVVYDFGGGTFDAAVVRRTADGFEVLAADGLPDVGGLDLDAELVAHVRAGTAGAGEAWGRLDWPQSAADRRARRLLWQDAREAKQQLSRHPSASVHVPVAEADVLVTREEFERLAVPLLHRTVEVTLGTLRAARVGPEAVGGVFLVGGSSRVPLAATMLHRALGIAPTVIDQPELVVAAGAPHAATPAADPAPPPQSPPPTPQRSSLPPQPPSPAPPRSAPPPMPVAPMAAAPMPMPAAPVPVPPSVAVPLARPGSPEVARPDAGRAATAPLRAVRWSVAAVAVLCLLSLLAILIVDSEEASSPRAFALVVSTVATGFVATLVWRFTRTPGARVWTAAGLLSGYALLAAASLVPRLPLVEDLAGSNVTFDEVALVNDLLVVAAAVFVAVALRRTPRPGGPHRRPPARWFAWLVAGAVVADAGYLLAFSVPSGLLWTIRLVLVMLLAVALPVYGVRGRPAVLATGVLGGWFVCVLRLAAEWNDDDLLALAGAALFAAGSLLALVAARRCLAAERPAGS